MSDIKKFLKTKNYTISTLVLKGITKLNLSLTEFLLILYFINEKKELDIEDIKNKLDIDENNILNSYNNLISKKIIEIVMTKTNDGITEEISLDLLYDKIIFKNEEQEKETDIYEKFEMEFGRTLSPMEYQTINTWITNGVTEEIIIDALKESILNGVTNLRYIDKILAEKKEPKEDYKELFDYDWLGENKND